MGVFHSDKPSPRTESHDITTGKSKPHHIGKKTIEVKRQELISHIQNYQETFNSAELNNWLMKLDQLTQALRNKD